MHVYLSNLVLVSLLQTNMEGWQRTMHPLRLKRNIFQMIQNTSVFKGQSLGGNNYLYTKIKRHVRIEEDDSLK